MPATTAPFVRDSDEIVPIARMLHFDEASSLGGAAHELAFQDRASRDRDGDTGLVRRLRGSDPAGIANEALVSLAGAAAGNGSPEAMLVRRARVTGSGGASSSAPSSDLAGIGATIGLPDGAAVSFATLADFRPASFL